MTGSVVWAAVSYVMFSLVCRPLRERWADILENDDYPSGLTPRGFLGMVVIKLVYRFLMVLLELLDHFLGLDQLVTALGLGQFMRTLLGIRTRRMTRMHLPRQLNPMTLMVKKQPLIKVLLMMITPP